MSTKTSDQVRARSQGAAPKIAGPTFPDTVAYWLEDDLGNRVSRLYAASEKPLRLAGRVLENRGSLDGWAVARQDTSGVRHEVAASADLEVLATPFMPRRMPRDAELVRRFGEARRRDLGLGTHADPVRDERVY